MEMDAWKSSKALTKLSIICLLIPFKKVDSVKVDTKHASYHSEVISSLVSSLSDGALPRARPDLNPAAPLDSVQVGAVSRWRRSPAGPLDLSAAASGGGYGGYGGGGGYGYNHCDCSGYDLIGLIAGGAALAAVATFLINQLINNGGGRRAFDLSLLPDGLTEMLAGVLPQPTEMFALKAVSRTCDVISDFERSQISVVESRDGGSGRSDCECFPGLAGALAGFAALGALIAFAVAQAIANAGGGRRSMSTTNDSEEEFAPSGLALAGAMLALLVVDDASCLPHQLCHLNSRARRAGYPYSYVVRVASLPLSWVLMKTTGEPMTNLCAGATSLAVDGHNCDVTFPRCAF